jgi:hypothetical protein
LGPVIQGHLLSVFAIAFVSDVAAVSESEKDAAEWIANPMEWKKIACSLLRRKLSETEARQYLGSKQSPRDPCSEIGKRGNKSWLLRLIAG